MKPKLLGDWLACLLVRLMVCWIQALRIETCQTISRMLALLMAEVIGVRRGVVRENLSRAFPDKSPEEIRRLTRQMWEHLFLMVCEVAHAPRKLHDTNWRDHITIPNKVLVLRQLLSPRPSVLVSGHFGNFEVAGFTIGLLGFPTFTVARRLDNPFLDRYLNAFRQLRGQYILPKDGSAPQIDAILAAGETLVLLGDQYGGDKGCWIEFLGRPASCHKAVALFSIGPGAPIAVGTATREGGPLRFCLAIEAVADPADRPPELASVRSVSQWYSDHLAAAIRRAPAQYWWIHRRWKDTRSEKRKRNLEKRAA